MTNGSVCRDLKRKERGPCNLTGISLAWKVSLFVMKTMVGMNLASYTNVFKYLASLCKIFKVMLKLLLAYIYEYF